MSPRFLAGPSLSHQLPKPEMSLLSCLLCSPLISLPPQDPSSPHSVHSYSSRENGVEKAPLGRKEAVPLSPTSMASSSSTSPSRSKDAPTVRVTPSGAVLVSLLPGLGWQWSDTSPLPPNPWGRVLERQGRAPTPLDLSSNPLPHGLSLRGS